MILQLLIAMAACAICFGWMIMTDWLS